MTRVWQESRSRDNVNIGSDYLITLDYDSVDESFESVHKGLIELKINHFMFTTWTHKTIETPGKKNGGKNCFKVMLELTADNSEELLRVTKGLGALIGKLDINKSDDISSGIFFGGVHPDHADDFEFSHYVKGLGAEKTKKLLIENCPEDEVISKDPMDDFEMWDKTQGQKWTPQRIALALSIIKYEEIGDFSRMQIWHTLGYALHSTGDDANFDLWDNWCLENCGEHGVYNREENEAFWAKKKIPKDHKNLCTLASLWHLEGLFKAKQNTSEIRQSSWLTFDTLANETPEEVQFLIDGLLVEKSIGFLVGTGGVGKSSMCLEVAKAISSGSCFFGDEKHGAMKGTVALINKEDSLLKVHNQIHNLIALDGERILRGEEKVADFDDVEGVNSSIARKSITEREQGEIISQWENVARPTWAQSNIRLTNNEGENLEALGAVMGSLKSLKEELEEDGKPPLRLVIFDPLNLWHGGDQNSQKDMSYIFSALQTVQKELDTAVLIVHHMNKSNGFSGSHTLRDSGRFMWYLRPMMIGVKEVSDKYIDLYVEKNNDAKANYTPLRFTRTEKGLLDVANINLEEVKEKK